MTQGGQALSESVDEDYVKGGGERWRQRRQPGKTAISSAGDDNQPTKKTTTKGGDNQPTRKAKRISQQGGDD